MCTMIVIYIRAHSSSWTLVLVPDIVFKYEWVLIAIIIVNM